MSMIAKCTVCDAPVNPYGGETRCERCAMPCRTCGGATGFCPHPLHNDWRIVRDRDPETGNERVAA